MVYKNQFYQAGNNNIQYDFENTTVDNNASKDLSKPLGGIIIKNIQCSLKKKQTAKISKLMKSILKENPKLRLEFEYNQETRSTCVLEMVGRPDRGQEKYGAWDENVIFVVTASTLKSSTNADLFIRCWDPSIKGRIGCVGEAKLNLAHHEKFNNEETYCELDLGYNESIMVSFCVYFFSNDPPRLMMQKFDDPNIRGQKIGVIMINKIQLTNETRPSGQTGYLEFELEREKECHSMKKYWNSTQSPWKYPITLSFIARHEELIIRFCYGSTGSTGSTATTKFHIGPAAATEVLWPSLMTGKSVNVGEYTLMEHGLRVGKVRFEISCHCLITSVKFYKICTQYQAPHGQKQSITDNDGLRSEGGAGTTNVSSGQRVQLSSSRQNNALQNMNRNRSSIQNRNQIEQQRQFSPSSTSRVGAGGGFAVQTDQQTIYSTSQAGASGGLNAQRFGGSSSQLKAINPSSSTLRTYVSREYNNNDYDPHPYMNTSQTPSLKSDDSHSGRSLQESLPEAPEVVNPQNGTHSHGHEGRSKAIRYLQDDIPKNLQTQTSLPSLRGRDNLPTLSSHGSHSGSMSTSGRTGYSGGAIVTGGNGGITGTHRMSLTQYPQTHFDPNSHYRNNNNKGQRHSDPVSPISSSFTLIEDNLPSQSSVARFAHNLQEISGFQQLHVSGSKETLAPSTTSALSGTNESTTLNSPVAQETPNSEKQQGAETLLSRINSLGSINTTSSKHTDDQSISVSSSFLPTSSRETSSFIQTSSKRNSENSITIFTPHIICDRYVITARIIGKKRKSVSTQSITNVSLSSHHQSDSLSSQSNPSMNKSPTQSTPEASSSSHHSTTSRRVEPQDSQRSQLFAVINSNQRRRTIKHYKGHVVKVPENLIIIKVFEDKMSFENENFFLRKFLKSKYVVKLIDVESNVIFRDNEFEEVGNESSYYDYATNNNRESQENENEGRNSGEKGRSELSNGSVNSEFDSHERSTSLIITKYHGESLESNIHSFKEKREIVAIFRKICEGVKWLHDNGVVHMSLNPSCILCKETDIYNVRFCDFENTKDLDEQVYPEFISSYVPSTKTNSFASTEGSFITPPSPSDSFIDEGSHLPCNTTSSTFQIQVTTTRHTTTNYSDDQSLISDHSEKIKDTPNSQPTIPHYPIGFTGPEIILPQLLLASKSTSSSPELVSFLKNIRARRSVDCFSLGAILYYLCTKKLLYSSIEELEWLVRKRKQSSDDENVNDPKDFNDDTNEGVRGNEKEYEINSLAIDVDETLDEDIREVMSMCLKIDEYARWNIEEILASRLMNQD
ncbi:4031_t:CDS:2 [Acaulospora morrowiae]|uniref:4031_t:CDS:1 n=1 Tax=Acaulospora morrowiae TaxID=94023 RepID=A0A9N8Z1Z3_9GLOM|nr:4031_t:CDS:2 [Acaulospora morrowiae]